MNLVIMIVKVYVGSLVKVATNVEYICSVGQLIAQNYQNTENDKESRKLK